jgi:hypothetical protein
MIPSSTLEHAIVSTVSKLGGRGRKESLICLTTDDNYKWAISLDICFFTIPLPRFPRLVDRATCDSLSWLQLQRSLNAEKVKEARCKLGRSGDWVWHISQLSLFPVFRAIDTNLYVASMSIEVVFVSVEYLRCFVPNIGGKRQENRASDCGSLGKMYRRLPSTVYSHTRLRSFALSILDDRDLVLQAQHN